MIETDILVVGAGPAGATTAKFLSKAGVSNILLQRNFSFNKPCGGGIRIDAFDEFEIDKKLIIKEVDTLKIIFKTKKIDLDITKNPLAIVSRMTFDHALRTDAQKLGSILYEAIFVDLEIFDTHVISRMKYKDEYIRIKSNYVVAADGVNSKIRKLVNGDSVSAGMTNYTDITQTEYDTCEIHFGEEIADKYYAWAFPHAEGSNIGTAGEDNTQNNIKTFLSSLDIKEETKILGYKIPYYDKNIFYKDRVFFVGDCASQVLPFTFEGIYYAMGSARILSDVIINKESPDTYEKEWNVKYKSRFDALLKLQKIFLYNNFTISLMIRLFENPSIQTEMVKLWMQDRKITPNIKFFYRAFKKIFFKS